MNKCLACLATESRTCKKCEKKFCDFHFYPLKGVCIHCYYEDGPSLPRSGKMKMSELFKKVRELFPHRYVSISVKIDDHGPGENVPSITWGIYHEQLKKTIEGPTPEDALRGLKELLKEGDCNIDDQVNLLALESKEPKKKKETKP